LLYDGQREKGTLNPPRGSTGGRNADKGGSL
jgi:hypothetical protein